MNFNLEHLPERPNRPRQPGLTMVMDKGISLRQAEDLVSLGGECIDILKLGFGTSYLAPDLKEKIKLYRKNGVYTMPTWVVPAEGFPRPGM